SDPPAIVPGSPRSARSGAQAFGTAASYAGGGAEGPGNEIAALRQHRHHGRLLCAQHQEPVGPAERVTAPLPGGQWAVQRSNTNAARDPADPWHRDGAFAANPAYGPPRPQ